METLKKKVMPLASTVTPTPKTLEVVKGVQDWVIVPMPKPPRCISKTR